MYVAPVGTTDWREVGVIATEADAIAHADAVLEDVLFRLLPSESPDETFGMTIDELLGEIDDVLDSVFK